MENNKYKNLTLEEIEKAINSYEKEQPSEKISEPFVKDLGDGLFKIGGRLITNRAGLILYNAALKKAGEEYLKNLNKQYE